MAPTVIFAGTSLVSSLVSMVTVRPRHVCAGEESLDTFVYHMYSLML